MGRAGPGIHGGVVYIATNEGPAVYVQSSWNQADFAAGGFCLGVFVGVGSGKEIKALTKGVDEKFCILGWAT